MSFQIGLMPKCWALKTQNINNKLLMIKNLMDFVSMVFVMVWLFKTCVHHKCLLNRPWTNSPLTLRQYYTTNHFVKLISAEWYDMISLSRTCSEKCLSTACGFHVCVLQAALIVSTCLTVILENNSHWKHSTEQFLHLVDSCHLKLSPQSVYLK